MLNQLSERTKMGHHSLPTKTGKRNESDILKTISFL